MINELLLLLTANAALVAVLAWIAKLFLKFQVDKDLARFSRDLSDKSERELRVFSATLDTKMKEREIRYSLLYEKKALCLCHIYGVLSKAERISEELRGIAGVKKWSDLKTIEYGHRTARALDEKLEELKGYHDDHRIFLDDDTSKGIEVVIAMLQLFSIRFKDVVNIPPSEESASFESWWKGFLETTKKQKCELRDRFRKTIEPA